MPPEPRKEDSWHDARQLDLGLRIVQNQERQIELDAKRLEHESQVVDKGYEFSMRALQAEASDKFDQRKRRNQLAVILSAIGAVVLLTLAILNKDQLLLDLAKVGAGVALGYGIRASRKPADPQDP